MSPEKTIKNGSVSLADGTLGKKIASSLSSITLYKVTEIGFKNAKANSSWIEQGKNIFALEESPLMNGENALVIAAGPSLHRFEVAKLIKSSGFKGVIITTDSAMSWCLRHGIVPDLVVTLDPHAHRIVRWFGDPNLTQESLENDDYFARQDMDPKFRDSQLRVNQELLELINQHAPKIRIAVSSSVSPSVVKRIHDAGMPVYWWNPMYDDYDFPDSLTDKIHRMNRLPCLNAGGNVGSACWVFAHAVLKKKRVGLVGVDFGYYPTTPYRQTQYYNEILALVGPDRLNEVFVRVMNPHVGSEFYTDPAYLWYRDGFLEMVKQAECVTYNCTGGGILFGPGIHWVELSRFLSISTKHEKSNHG